MVTLLSRIRYLILTSALLLLLWGLLRWLNETHESRGAEERAASVASLLDADTALMLHIPDVDEARLDLAAAHFTRLNLHHGLSTLVGQLLGDFPPFERWREGWSQDRPLEITEATIALTPAGTGWNLLTIFRSPAASDPFFASRVEWWRENHPEDAPVLEESHHQEADVRYLTVTRGSDSLFSAHWQDWHLASEDRDILDRALRRLRTGQTLGALGSLPRFRQSLAPLRRDYSLLLFSARLADPVAPNSGTASPEPPEDQSPTAEPLTLDPLAEIDGYLQKINARSLALAFALHDGQIVEDAMVVAASPPEPLASPDPPLLDATLDLTSPQTLAYLTANEGASGLRRFLFDAHVRRWKVSTLPALQDAARTWHSHFEAPWSLQLEPLHLPPALTDGDGPMAQPLAAILALSLKEPSTLQSTLAKLAEVPGSGIRPSGRGTFLLEQALLPSSVTSLMEEIHFQVSSKLLLVSGQAAAIAQAHRRRSSSVSLRAKPQFQKLIGRLPKPDLGLAYIDGAEVLRRGSDALQHPLVLATLWMGIRSQTRLQIDLQTFATPWEATLPIIPTMATWQRTPGVGYRQSSLGTLSPLQWTLGAAAIISIIDKTFLEPAAVTESDGFATPALEQELLRMMEP